MYGKLFYYAPSLIYNYTKYVCGLQDYVATVKHLCTTLAQINIFYVKFFQWFTESVQDEELFAYFKQFKTNVPFTPADIDTAAIDHIQQTFQNKGQILKIDLAQPLNSGTVALVFKGTLENFNFKNADKKEANADKRPVVLKVLRVNILQELENMYAHYTWVTWFIKWLRPDIKIDFLKMITDTRENCFAQLDFLQEAQNIQTFEKKFQKNKRIVIPQVYAANKAVLVMDYLDGHPLDAWTVPDYHAYAKAFTYFLISSYFIKDVYHGDLHMGNIVFLKDHRIGLIDFGLVGELTIANQNFILELFQSLGANDYKAVVRLYMDYVLNQSPESIESPESPESPESIDREVIIADAITTLEVTGNTNIYMLNHTHLLILFQTLYKYGLSLDKNMNIYLYSILSMIDTMKRLMSQEQESHLINIFERLNREYASEV